MQSERSLNAIHHLILLVQVVIEPHSKLQVDCRSCFLGHVVKRNKIATNDSELSATPCLEKTISHLSNSINNRDTHVAVTSILGQRALIVGHLMPVDMPQTAVTLLQALWQLILRYTRQWRQPEHLDDDFSDLLCRELAAGFCPLPNQGVTCLEETGIAAVDDVLECNEGASKSPVRLEVSRKVFGHEMRLRRLNGRNGRRWGGSDLLRLFGSRGEEVEATGVLNVMLDDRWWGVLHRRGRTRWRGSERFELLSYVWVTLDLDGQSELQLAVFNANGGNE